VWGGASRGGAAMRFGKASRRGVSDYHRCWTAGRKDGR
jgi:hypothetical protein